MAIFFLRNLCATTLAREDVALEIRIGPRRFRGSANRNHEAA